MDWCCMCWCSGENVDHLRIHCVGASWLWSYAFRSFVESLGSYLRGWLIYWLNGGIGSGSTRRIFGIWYCIV